MLNFFRKHQRFFFIVVTIFVVISFTFFGTYSTFSRNDEAPDRVIGKAVDGSSIYLRELDVLSRFVSTSIEDRGLLYSGKMPNLLSDNVIRTDLLATGLGQMLAERYFDEVKGDLDARLKKVKAYKPYFNKAVPFLNAHFLWKRFVPSMEEHFRALQARSDVPSVEAFFLLGNLYSEQSYLPADVQMQILSKQMRQAGMQGDSEMTLERLSLFGFQSLEDWFGPKFIDIACQFMTNAALVAEKKGYKVTNEEVRAELLQNAYSSMQALSSKEKSTFTDEEIKGFYNQQLQTLGVNEEMALKAWKKVILFRRLFNDVGFSVVLDPLSHEQFGAYAREAVAGDLYELPESLRFKDFRTMLKLQVYLDAVGKNKTSTLALPKSFLTADEAEKRAPQLTQRKYVLEYSGVDKKEILQRISLKQTWEWELANWDALKKEFPSLAQNRAENNEQKFLVLDKMEAQERQKIDDWASEKIFASHPEWIQEALSKAEVKKEVVAIRYKDGKIPFQGVKDPAYLISLLQSPSQEAAKRLSFFTADNESFYKIRVIERADKKEIVSFVQAAKDGTLDLLLDKKLEEAYPEVRKKDAAFKTDNDFKPFVQVKDLVGTYVFSDLLRSIEQVAKREGENVDKKPSLDFYVGWRLFDYMKEAKEHIAKNPQDLSLIGSDRVFEKDLSEMPLEEQWKVRLATREIKRCDNSALNSEELFSLPEGSFSKVAVRAGELSFFRVLKRVPQENASFEKMMQGQQLLALDAKRHYMSELLNQIQEKGAIVPRTQGEAQ